MISRVSIRSRVKALRVRLINHQLRVGAQGGQQVFPPGRDAVRGLGQDLLDQSPKGLVKTAVGDRCPKRFKPPGTDKPLARHRLPAYMAGQKGLARSRVTGYDGQAAGPLPHPAEQGHQPVCFRFPAHQFSGNNKLTDMSLTAMSNRSTRLNAGGQKQFQGKHLSGGQLF